MKTSLYVMVLLLLSSGHLPAQSVAGTLLNLPLQGGVAGVFTGNVTGQLNYIPNFDVLGAHDLGGRSCAGCHSPHNGSTGNGGTATDGTQGALWGVDTSAIMSNYASGISFDGGNSRYSGQLTWTPGALNPSTAWQDATYRGVATCLSCHDGSVSSSAMMSGVSYEQAFGLLNGTAPVGLNTNRNGVLSTTLYGPNPIPTYLGGNTGLGYTYQHPLGQTANLGKVLGNILTNSYYGLSAGVSGNSISVSALTANSPYANFVATYYPGAVMATISQANSTNVADNFLVCTTCHNQHNMAVYGGGQSGETVPVGITQVRTTFFVNGAYNPGAPYDPTHVPSTMRFCQQCHFWYSSEYYGASNVGTAY